MLLLALFTLGHVALRGGIGNELKICKPEISTAASVNRLTHGELFQGVINLLLQYLSYLLQPLIKDCSLRQIM